MLRRGRGIGRLVNAVLFPFADLQQNQYTDLQKNMESPGALQKRRLQIRQEKIGGALLKLQNQMNRQKIILACPPLAGVQGVVLI